jgi:hypothetical protein
MMDKIDSTGIGDLKALAGNTSRLEALATETGVDLQRLRKAASGQAQLSAPEAARVAAALSRSR